MQFIILGSGTHFPDPKHRSAGYVLRDGKNLALFDFGYGTLLRLVELNVRYQDIQHIFFTHLHKDHFLDILPFLTTVENQVAQWGLSSRTLTLYGPRGFTRILKKIFAGLGKKSFDGITIQYRELSHSRVKLGHAVISTHPVKHYPSIKSIAYRISRVRHSLAYTGDLDYDEKIIPFLRGVATLVIECGLPNELKHRGHLTPRECGMIAAKAGVKRVILTHRYPPCDLVNIVAQCKREFKGLVHLAKDGAIISF
ncbi:MAG: MBL fold metallo-hydrolase [Patescibacteria group bacterium]